MTSDKILQDRSPYTPLYYDVRKALNVIVDKPAIKSDFTSLSKTIQRLLLFKIKTYYMLITKLVLLQSLPKQILR